jgi:hypothetical protein
MRNKAQARTRNSKTGTATPALIAAIALLGASLGVTGGAMAQGSGAKPKTNKPPSNQTNANQGLSKKPQSKQAEPDKKTIKQDEVTSQQKSTKKLKEQTDSYIKQ